MSTATAIERGITPAQYQTLLAAAGDRDLVGQAWQHESVHATAARVAALWLTAGTDVEATLIASGFPQSSARRWRQSAEEALGPRPPEPEAALRSALGDALYFLENPTEVIPANRVRQLRHLAGVRAVPDGATPFGRGMEGSARAAAKWTDDEVAAVDAAIETAASRAADKWAAYHDRDSDGPWFTADDVWSELGPTFLVTKGLSGRLVSAAHRGILVNTGRTVISTREGEHGHGQRLTVYRPGPAITGDDA